MNNNNNNNNNKNDQSVKHDRRSYRSKRRMKSSIVRDSNGSINTFRQFYQSGGRDYEQYRLWLQTLSNTSNDSDKIKKEPIDSQSNISSTNLQQQQPISTSKTIVAHPSVKSIRHLSLPMKSSHSLPLFSLPASYLTTNLFESQIRSLYDHASLLITPPMRHWSVTDVGQFIERHFPEKNIAQKFIEQKIDGRTLPLLTEDHLTRIFNMKLGPALHLLALISTIPK